MWTNTAHHAASLSKRRRSQAVALMSAIAPVAGQLEVVFRRRLYFNWRPYQEVSTPHDIKPYVSRIVSTRRHGISPLADPCHASATARRCRFRASRSIPSRWNIGFGAELAAIAAQREHERGVDSSFDMISAVWTGSMPAPATLRNRRRKGASRMRQARCCSRKQRPSVVSILIGASTRRRSSPAA